MKKKGSFANPIAPNKRQMEFPFQAPTKEQATTGRFYPAGDDHGVGFNQPVGHENNPKQRVDVMPMKSKCFSAEDVF